VSMEHMDRTVLLALQEVMEEEYPLLLDTFLNDSRQRLAQLQQATDAEALEQAAHSFKGSSSNMGAMYLADLCRQLEEQAGRMSPQARHTLVSLISTEFATVLDLYTRERQRYPI